MVLYAYIKYIYIFLVSARATLMGPNASKENKINYQHNSRG